MIVGVGLDLVDIARVQALVAAKGERALRRLFTPREADYASARPRPFLHLAARVAAKEATFKALSAADGARGIGWREMEVVAGLGVTHVHLTLSHSETTAGAVVVLERGAEPAAARR